MVHLRCHRRKIENNLLLGMRLPTAGEDGGVRGFGEGADGQLYVSGMSGWGSYTPDDGSFQRLR